MGAAAEPASAAASADAIAQAIAAGRLDQAREALRHGPASSERRAELYCRLSEALFYAERREEAVACAAAAFEPQPCGEDVADFCAWLFSNTDRHEQAAAAYRRLLEIRQGWAAGHRHASGSERIAGQLDRAASHARTASDLEPGNFDYAINAAAILAEAGDRTAGLAYLRRAAAAAPQESAALCALSSAASALGEAEEALAFALAAWRREPRAPANAILASELLLRADRAGEAQPIIAEAARAHPENAVVLRMLSATEMACGRFDDALAAIEHALALAPENADYHIHRGNLLYRLGRVEEAGVAFARAAALDPANPAAKRAQLTAYFDGGRYPEALAVGGELMRAAPDNEEYAQAVLQVLNRRFETLDGDFTVLDEGIARAPRRKRPPPGFLDGVATQLRVVHALIIRETRTRFGEARLGYAWALIEPILHILMLCLVFAVIMDGQPPLGRHFFVFYYTGLMPYHLFVHTSSNLTFAVTSNGSLLQLPLVSTVDVILARALLELATDLVVAVILFTGFYVVGIGALPRDALGVGEAILLVWLFSCGLGYLNAVITAFFKSWDKLWVQLVRILYFASGIFYVPSIMPDWMRHILVWNPVLQAVDWFRVAFFSGYEPHWLSRSYLVSVVLLTLLAGLALERGLRRHLFEPA